IRAIVEAQIGSLFPAELCEGIGERPAWRLYQSILIGFRIRHPPDPLDRIGLLRASAEGPRRRPTEKCNDFAPSHAKNPVSNSDQEGATIYANIFQTPDCAYGAPPALRNSATARSTSAGGVAYVFA